MKAFTVICALITCTYSQYSEAQPLREQGYYGPVLDQYSGIAGNFGEMRSGHFHAGIDFKTSEEEGYPVYAAADGFISRIKISSVGYGKALYINHPNGTTTVYGHLKQFKKDVETSMRALQYGSQNFEQQIFPEKGEFPVKKGELIAWSGNTGGSHGPHLHFEIRNTESEKPFDPVLAGFEYVDSIAPVITEIAIYHPGPYGGLFKASRSILPVHKSDLSAFYSDTVYCDTVFFVGINSFDLAGEGVNTLGVQKIQIIKNDSLEFEFNIKEFEFSVSRYVNACIDFPLKSDSGKTIIICHKLNGNILDFYPYGDGLLKMNQGDTANIKIKVFDQFENISHVEIMAICTRKPKTKNYLKNINEVINGEQFDIIKKDYSIHFPKNTFYETVALDVTTDSIKNKSIVNLLKILPENLGVQNKIELKFHIGNFPDTLISKALICKLLPGNNLESYGGKIKGKEIITSIRSLGVFGVFIDSMPPVADKMITLQDEQLNQNKILIRVHDNLAGIDSYKCTINGKWVLAEFNASRGELLIYKSEIGQQNDDFLLEVELIDNVGNTSITNFSLNN